MQTLYGLVQYIELFCVFMIFVSVFTPKTAFFLKTPTKKRAACFWGGVAFLLLLFMSFVFKDEIKQSAKNRESASEQISEKSEVSPTIDTAPAVIKGIPLNYTVLKRDEEVRASIKRNRLRLTIIPTQDQSAASQADLAATVVSVAIQEQKKSGIPVVIVNMLCQQAANSYGELQLAHAVYIPDGKGFDGKTAKPVWETLSAAPRGFTAQELEYLRLWAEMRGDFQKNGMTDEQALKAAISQRMGMTVESLNPHFNVLEPLEKKLEIAEPAEEKALVSAVSEAQSIPTLTPEQEEKKWQEARANMVKVTTPVQAELKALYAELLAMRGTKNFVELGFSKNNKIASDWKGRVEAFRTRIEKNTDIPPQVRAAPAYLLMLGMGREWRAGGNSDGSKGDMQMINDGINWKLEE